MEQMNHNIQSEVRADINETNYSLDDVARGTKIYESYYQTGMSLRQSTIYMMEDGNYVEHSIINDDKDAEQTTIRRMDEAEIIEQLKVAAHFNYEFYEPYWTVCDWLTVERLNILRGDDVQSQKALDVQFCGFRIENRNKLVAFFFDKTGKMYQFWYYLDYALGYSMRRMVEDYSNVSDLLCEEAYKYIAFEQEPDAIILESDSINDTDFLNLKKSDFILHGEPCHQIARCFKKMAARQEHIFAIGIMHGLVSPITEFEDCYYSNHLHSEAERLLAKANEQDLFR